MCFDAQPFKFCPVSHGGAVVADFADVPGSQAPLLTRSDRGSNLAARQNIRGAKFYLGSERGVVRQENQHVGSVEPDTDNVNLGGCRHDSVEAGGAPE